MTIAIPLSYISLSLISQITADTPPPSPVRLLVRLGPVFLPLARDVLQKLVQLDCLRKGGAGTSYTTIEAMMEYETAGDQLTLNSAGNGCRTLLRLHRSLGMTAADVHVQAAVAG